MRVLKVMALGVVGFLLGLGIWKLSSNGVGESWKQLPMPPQTVSELVPFGDPPLFIKTSDGKTYDYEDWRNGGWVEKPIPPKPFGPFDVTRPCNHSFPEFSLSLNAPGDIVDCFQETTWYADGNIKYAFVLDSKGTIWEWEHAVTPENLTELFCFPLFGLLICGVVAFVATAK